MKNPYQIVHPKKRAFLAAYTRLGTIRAGCEAAGIGRQTYYDWTERDEQFVMAANLAKQEYADRLEEKLSELSMDKDNVTALIVALKIAGRFVETAKVINDTTVRSAKNPEDLSDAELAALIAERRDAVRSGAG